MENAYGLRAKCNRGSKPKDDISKLKANETLRFPAAYFIIGLVLLFFVWSELQEVLSVGNKCDDIMLEHGRSMCR